MISGPAGGLPAVLESKPFPTVPGSVSFCNTPISTANARITSLGLAVDADRYGMGFNGAVWVEKYGPGSYNGPIEFSVTGELADEFVVIGGQGTGRLKWEGGVYRDTYGSPSDAWATATFTTPFGKREVGWFYFQQGCYTCSFFVPFEFGIPYELALTLQVDVRGTFWESGPIYIGNSFRLSEIQDMDGNRVEGVRVINASELPEPGTLMTMAAGIVATWLLRRFIRP